MSAQPTEGIQHQYSVIVTYDAEEAIYNASVPALGIVTDGFTIEHAFEMAEEAISLRVELARESGESLPVEDRPAELRLVAV
jgi:predicted RNase H-like HicB family nuclease